MDLSESARMKRQSPGLPPGPEGVEFDAAVDELMDVTFLIDRYDRETVQVSADAVQVLTFLVRWIIDENTGNAPSLYDRAKGDFESWQRCVAMAGGMP